jgi:quercetin dioxygenase-like cupin family protein
MDSSTASGFVVPPGEALQLRGPVGGPIDIGLHGSRTGGRFTALENLVGPGQGPPLHFHDEQDEAWYVLEGSIRFRIGDELALGEQGAWAFVPRGVPHCFQNVGDGPARILVMFSPAGMEPFFESFAQLDEGDQPQQQFALLGEPCGMHVVGPPLAVSHPR